MGNNLNNFEIAFFMKYEAKKRTDENMYVSKELWLCIAERIEENAKTIRELEKKIEELEEKKAGVNAPLVDFIVPYIDPCKSCFNGKCEQCSYGYISEEEKIKVYKANVKDGHEKAD